MSILQLIFNYNHIFRKKEKLVQWVVVWG